SSDLSMIAVVLDLARGRRGGGVGIAATERHDLSMAIEQVIDEIAVAHPDREIIRDVRLDVPVRADLSRLSQLISNLLANAIHHGAKDQPVRLRACVSDGSLLIEVVNRGAVIPDEIAHQLFQPFRRASVSANQDGLGLGLYIASEIAKAHGGTLRMTQEDGEIRFVFRMAMSGADR
ncbi:MAG: sensor histidine kinase, partial [Phycisphaerales bacterium]